MTSTAQEAIFVVDSVLNPGAERQVNSQVHVLAVDPIG